MYIEYQLTIKDLGEAIQTHKKSIKLLMLIYMIILGLALLLAEEYRVWGFLIIIYNIYSFYFSQKNLIKQEWKQNKLLKEHYTVEISEEYIYAKTSLSETKYCWEVFVEFRETKNLFVFYFLSIMMWVIPKSAFLEKADLDQFRDLAKEQIPSQFNYKNKN